MATGGEVPGRHPGSAGFEHLSQRICQPCLEKDNVIDAIGLCVDCQDYLCLKCFDYHMVQKHRLLDREQLMHRKNQAKPDDSCSDSCPVHENEVIQYYCARHCHLGCKSCINIDHVTCDGVQYIPRMSKELANNEDYKQMETQLKSALDTFMLVFRNAQRNSDEIDKSCKDALRELHSFKRQVDKALESIERELVEKAHTLRLKAEQDLAEMRNKYKAAHEELQSSLAKIEALHNANQNCSSYIEMMKTNSKILSLEDQIKQAEVDISYKESPVQFSKNRDLLELLSNPGGFGTLSSAGTRNVASGSDEVPVVSNSESGSVIALSDDFTVLSHETGQTFSNDFSVITDTGSRMSQPSLPTGNIEPWLSTVSNLHVPGSEIESITLGSDFPDYHTQDLYMYTGSSARVILSDKKLLKVNTENGKLKVSLQTGEDVAQSKLPSKSLEITVIDRNEMAVTRPSRLKKSFGSVSIGDYYLHATEH